MADDKTFSLQELADAAGVTPRTIRLYISEGLLPSPGLGRDARYTQVHLDRLALIKEQREKHISLAGIRVGLQLPGPHGPARPPWALDAGDWTCREIGPGILVLVKGGTASLWSRTGVKAAVEALAEAVKKEER